jgi:hypothetical protein
MSVIYLPKVRAARAALNLAESLSSDPVLRAAARARALGEVMRRERLARQPQLAEVVVLPTRLTVRAAPKDY